MPRGMIQRGGKCESIKVYKVLNNSLTITTAQIFPRKITTTPKPSLSQRR